MIKWYINVIFLINPISPLLDYGCHNCNSKSKIHRNELSVSLIEIKSRIVTPLFISRCISLLYIHLNAADCHAENSLGAINRDWVFQKRSKVWFLPENVTQHNTFPDCSILVSFSFPLLSADCKISKSVNKVSQCSQFIYVFSSMWEHKWPLQIVCMFSILSGVMFGPVHLLYPSY